MWSWPALCGSYRLRIQVVRLYVFVGPPTSKMGSYSQALVVRFHKFPEPNTLPNIGPPCPLVNQVAQKCPQRPQLGLPSAVLIVTSVFKSVNCQHCIIQVLLFGCPAVMFV